MFSVRFICTGKTTGQVDMTFNLNYTKVTAASVDVEDFKSFSITARRKCLKTGICFYFSSLPFLLKKALEVIISKGCLLASQLVNHLYCNYLGHTFLKHWTWTYEDRCVVYYETCLGTVLLQSLVAPGA